MTRQDAKTCIPLERSMLDNIVDVIEQPEQLSFEAARRLADREAFKRSPDPMLIAWYDGRRGAFSPNVECCESLKPAWLVYAQSRGADCTVVINDLEYVFLYRLAEADRPS